MASSCLKHIHLPKNTFIFPRRIRHSVIHFNSRRKIILGCSAKFPTFDGRLKKEREGENEISFFPYVVEVSLHPSVMSSLSIKMNPMNFRWFFKTRLHPFKCVKLPAAPLNCRIQSRALCTRCEVEPFDRSFTDVLNEVFSYTQNNPDNLKPHREKKKVEREGKKIVGAIGVAEEKRLDLVTNRTGQKLLNCFPRVARLSRERSGRQTHPWTRRLLSGTN